MMLKIIICRLIWVISWLVSSLLASRDLCDNMPFEHCNMSSSNQYFLICSNFDSFSQLNFECKKRIKPISQLSPVKKVNKLSLAPKSPIIFSGDFLVPNNLSLLFDSTLEIYLYKLLGIELNTNLFDEIEDKSLYILDSIFEVYDNNRLVDNTFNMESKNQGLFSTRFTDVVFKPAVMFRSPLHPVVFKNAFISNLHVNGLMNSFLRVNSLRFIDIPNQPEYLNSSIEALYLTVQNVKLDNSLLNELVFSDLKYLVVTGHVISIEKRLFQNLNQINSVRFQIYSIKNFFHCVGLDWIGPLDTVENSNQVRIDFEQIDNDRRVLPDSMNPFLDEDFCLYSRANFSENIVINVPNYLTNNCSCSFVWLIKNSYNVNRYIDCLDDKNFSWFEAHCHFEKKLSRCKKTRPAIITTPSKDIIEDSSTFKIIKFYMVTSAKPILCLICFLLSLLDIKILLMDPINTLNGKSKMYSYIFIGAIIDSIISLLYLTELLNECIEPFGIYCVEFRKNLQFFKIIVQVYLRSVLETLSNSMSIAFSLNRYIINTAGCSRFMKKTEAVSIKRVFAGLLLLCMVINLNTIFDFVPTEEHFEGEGNSDRFYPRLNVELFGKSILFICVFYFNLFVNDILCAGIIFVIDLFLIQSVKENLRRKYQLTAEPKRPKRAQKNAAEEMVKKSMLFSFLSMEKIQQLNLIRKYRENKTAMMKKSSKEFKITLMVVLNGVFTILLRLPQLIISFMLISLSKRQKIMMSRMRRLNVDDVALDELVEFNFNFFNEFSKLFYIVSLIFKSLIYYMFDKNFKRALAKLFRFSDSSNNTSSKDPKNK